MFKFDAFLHINLCSNKKKVATKLVVVISSQLSWLSNFHGPFCESAVCLLDSEPDR